MNCIQKIVLHTSYSEQDVFFHSFRGQHEAVVRNHIRLYQMRGTIPFEVEKWCKVTMTEHQKPII